MTQIQSDEARKYELMLIISGDIPESQLEKEVGEIKKLLQESTKGITHEDNWGLKNFAFRFRKQNRGYYIVFNFDAGPQAISEMRVAIRLNPVILRHMLITVPDSYQPGHHEDPVIFRDEKKAEESSSSSRGRGGKRMDSDRERMPAKAPVVVGKQEEEQLKTVEKKLEKILENPDLDLK